MTKIIYTSVLAVTMCILLLIPQCKNGTESDQDGIDTTSHEMMWSVFTFGDRESYIYDVAIINEDSIWVVGEIYLNEEEEMHNAAKWNGTIWELKRLKIRLNYGQTVIVTDQDPLKTVFLTADGDLWFISRAGGVSRIIDGVYHQMKFEFGEGPGSVNKAWGTSSNNMYFVGPMGHITYYDGSKWFKLESPTQTDINDIWGAVNSQSGRKTILCPVSDRSHRGKYRLLTISNSTVKDTLNWDLERRILSVWFNHNSPVYECGSGLRVYKDNSWNEIDIPSYITLRVRGSAWNNIFVVGVFGLVMHYNGSTWHEYPELAFENGELKGLSVTDNLIVATGQTGSKGIIITGKRK